MKEIDIIAEAMLDKKAKNVCSLPTTMVRVLKLTIS